MEKAIASPGPRGEALGESFRFCLDRLDGFHIIPAIPRDRLVSFAKKRLNEGRVHRRRVLLVGG